MYLVVSHWQAAPGREEDFQERGVPVRAVLRSQPGVKLLEVFRDGDDYIAVHGYDSEDAYQRIVHDPDSAFNKAVQQNGLEEVSHWLRSWRGESVIDA